MKAEPEPPTVKGPPDQHLRASIFRPDRTHIPRTNRGSMNISHY